MLQLRCYEYFQLIANYYINVSMEFHQTGILQLKKMCVGKGTADTQHCLSISQGDKLLCSENLQSSAYKAYFHYIGWTQAESKNSQAVIDVRWL